MKRLFLISLVALLTAGPVLAEPEQRTYALNEQDLASIRTYITQTWDGLRRSTDDCKSFRDELTHANTMLFLPHGMELPPQIQALQTQCKLSIKFMPRNIYTIGDISTSNLSPGLLYLPKPYIVPGGMFNEMYGWDSYFIILGLVADHKLGYAEDMLDNVFFEIKNYGGILNANRSYYLSRSQPPFLTSMIRAVYEAKPAKSRKLAWLANAYEYALKDYNFWTTGEHLAGHTGLSRYYDFGSGPVPELGYGSHYYADVKQALGTTSLGGHFYKGDRAMRESGFDTTFRFGAFSGHTTDYAPVDLNSLLYKAERDLAWMCKQLNRPYEASEWLRKSAWRAQLMDQYLWNEKKGLYFDYNFRKHAQSDYLYVTTFYPLWARAASNQQAKKLEKNLALFEREGGLLSSLYHSGAQWDAPYGWAPLNYMAIKGLYNYHYDEDARRVSYKFLNMVLNNYIADKSIHEKYDVVYAKSTTNIKYGYTNNVIGFGWTNGVFLALLEKLKQ